MAKKSEPPTPTNPASLFWLTYRHPDGRAAGVVVMESHGLLPARLKAALAGADRDLEFVSGHKLDQENAGQIPENMMGRLLDDGDLRKPYWMLVKKKPHGASTGLCGSDSRDGNTAVGPRSRATSLALLPYLAARGYLWAL